MTIFLCVHKSLPAQVVKERHHAKEKERGTERKEQEEENGE